MPLIICFLLFDVIFPLFSIWKSFSNKMNGLAITIVILSAIILILAAFLGLRKFFFRQEIPPIYGRNSGVIDVSLVAASIMTLFAAAPPSDELDWLLYGALFIGIVLTPTIMQIEFDGQPHPEPQNRHSFLVYRDMVAELWRRRDFLSLAILILPIFCLAALMIAQASSPLS